MIERLWKTMIMSFIEYEKEILIQFTKNRLQRSTNSQFFDF